jgi:hypothetical protein
VGLVGVGAGVSFLGFTELMVAAVAHVEGVLLLVRVRALPHLLGLPSLRDLAELRVHYHWRLA